MKQMKQMITVLSLLLFITVTGNSQNLNGLDGIDSFIDSTMKQWSVPGVAIAVIKDGMVIYEKGYGYRNLKTKEKVTTQTLFSIASSSKAFTATLAAMVVEEKKMDFDTPLKEYFPEFRMYDEYATGHISLRDLLTHRSGIPRQKFFSLNTPPTRKNVRHCFRYFEPSANLGTRFQYCNETYSIAGDMIAERAGTSWEEMIKKRIFKPLGMNSTLLSVSEVVKTSDYSLPYIDWAGGKPEEMDFHDADILGPAGCIISNVTDLSKWIIFNLNRGKNQDKQLVNPALLFQTQTPQINISRSMAYKELFYQSYGMGWFINNYRGYVQINHGGVLYGFSSMVSFLPYEKIGVVVLTNLNGTPLTEIIERYVYDKMLGLSTIDWNDRFMKETARSMELYRNTLNQKDPGYLPDTKPSHPLREYTGTFKSDGYGVLKIVAVGDSLSTTLLSFKCPLRHYNYDVFDIYHPVERQSWKIKFVSDLTGSINSLTINIGEGLKEIVYNRIERN